MLLNLPLDAWREVCRYMSPEDANVALWCKSKEMLKIWKWEVVLPWVVYDIRMLFWLQRLAKECFRHVSMHHYINEFHDMCSFRCTLDRNIKRKMLSSFHRDVKWRWRWMQSILGELLLECEGESGGPYDLEEIQAQEGSEESVKVTLLMGIHNRTLDITVNGNQLPSARAVRDIFRANAVMGVRKRRILKEWLETNSEGAEYTPEVDSIIRM